MPKSIFHFIVISAAIFVAVALECCTYDKVQPKPKIENCDLETVAFSVNVQPILSKNCYVCHATRNAKDFGGSIDLENFDELKTYTEPVIRSIKQDDLPNYKAMPPRGKLSTCDIAIIEEWVKKGALK